MHSPNILGESVGRATCIITWRHAARLDLAQSGAVGLAAASDLRSDAFGAHLLAVLSWS
jgi:hypothetical protein